MSFSFPKFGVPSPVTGSHPVDACNNEADQHATSASASIKHKGADATHIESLRPTSRVVPDRDIVQAGHADAVQQRVQEPKRREPRVDPHVVEQRDDARERRRGRRRPTDVARLALEEDQEKVALRGDVRVGLRGRSPGEVRPSISQCSSNWETAGVTYTSAPVD